MSTRSRLNIRRAPPVDLLKAIPASELTLLLTDPPYQTVARHGDRYLKRWFRGSMSWPQIGRVLTMARRRMTHDGLAMVLVNEAGLPGAQAAMRQAGFARQRLVVWDQRVPGLGTGLRHQVAYVVIGLQPGSRSLVGRDLLSVPSVAPGTKNRYPTEKPIELGRQLAAMARIGRRDLVVDPFCGSGNLLVGAAERGARILAGDTSARAVALASRRLKQAAAATRSAATTRRGGPLLDSGQILGTRRSPPARRRPAAKSARRLTAERPGSARARKP